MLHHVPDDGCLACRHCKLTAEGLSLAASGSSLLLARLTLARPSVSSTTMTRPTLPCCLALVATRMVCPPHSLPQCGMARDALDRAVRRQQRWQGRSEHAVGQPGR